MNLDDAHKRSSHHRETVMQAKECACFYCLRTYAPAKIKKWTDKGDTALCPHCGIDSVVPDSTGPIDPAFLKAMYKRWFT